MARIIAGTARSRPLRVPEGARPTPDRVREALFSSLEHRGYIEGCSVLDLCAGSGALAFEALSRGAAAATAVDVSRAARSALTANSRSLGLELNIVTGKALTFLAQDVSRYDLIFLDPPYAMGEDELTELLNLAADRLVDDGLIVVERDKRSPEPTWPPGITGNDRRFGDTVLWSARRAE
ncbi:MAG: 16S rRNA (guanine(966)-N(2))-methyltransferase RsmD [Flaviflexus sp.]|nr:16S rRNA (guanine(966)-N(2))-methyltransferase RsmD [Flaviflexus sp.]